jgi:hypothetical protein
MKSSVNCCKETFHNSIRNYGIVQLQSWISKELKEIFYIFNFVSFYVSIYVIFTVMMTQCVTAIKRVVPIALQAWGPLFFTVLKILEG